MSQFREHRNGIGAVPTCPVLIGVGANLPGPDGCSALDTCRQAIEMMKQIPGMRVVGQSRWYLSAPIPPSGQPPYVNAVVALAADAGVTLDPAALLARLMEVETACGRQRSTPNAARTLDLDIVAIGDLVRDLADPIVPHPRAHLRAFVLAPLVDVAPDWVHPVLHKTAAALLADLPPQAIRAL
jgi:2-amino-4-hydroxy-6-hydroxymethyldihydropteridine diphosphokinase